MQVPGRLVLDSLGNTKYTFIVVFAHYHLKATSDGFFISKFQNVYWQFIYVEPALQSLYV